MISAEMESQTREQVKVVGIIRTLAGTFTTSMLPFVTTFVEVVRLFNDFGTN